MCVSCLFPAVSPTGTDLSLRSCPSLFPARLATRADLAELPAADRPAITSYSFGIDESKLDTAALEASCSYAQQLTALGHTIVVSSGDNGVNGESGGVCPPFRWVRRWRRPAGREGVSFAD